MTAYNKSAFKSAASYCQTVVKRADELYKKGGDGISEGLKLFSDKFHILNAVQKKSEDTFFATADSYQKITNLVGVNY